MRNTDEGHSRYQHALALHRQGRLAEAGEAYRQVQAGTPVHADALHMLAQIEFQSGNLEAAILLLEQSIQLHPGKASAHSDLGVMQQQAGRELLAIASFQDAVALDGNNPGAWNNLGNSLLAQGDHESALACYDRTLQLHPGHAQAHYNRGNALQTLARHEEAIRSFRQAIVAQPDYPEAHNNLSRSLHLLERTEEALGFAEAALRLRPGFVDALNNRALYLDELKRYDGAIAAYAELLRLQPGHLKARSCHLHAQLKCCDWREYREQVQAIGAAVAAGQDADAPFAFLSISDSPALQLACARARGREFTLQAVPEAGRKRADPVRDQADRRLRIAYLSSDYREHPMAHLISELFELHDRSRFEIIGVSLDQAPDSPARRRILAAFDRHVDVHGLDDASAARLLEGLGVDIAVDLNGYTALLRTGILARRPAPIQVQYMGYPGSMGTPHIDYILADPIVIPVEDQQHYSEQVVYLPDSYQVNDRKRVIAATPQRDALGLPAQGFVFCCFNNSYKLSPEVFDVWMRLLDAVEDSVLWLHESNPYMRANLAGEARSRGVDPSRLRYKPALRPEVHLACHRHADLFLDTLPYNAHTTASDALWAGLPVLTCLGRTFAGRVAASLLQAIGLPELITHSLAEYEALALHLARHPQELAALRLKLAGHRDSLPLFDTPRFCRHVESAYRMMWQRHVAGELPASFSVPRID